MIGSPFADFAFCGSEEVIFSLFRAHYCPDSAGCILCNDEVDRSEAEVEPVQIPRQRTKRNATDAVALRG